MSDSDFEEVDVSPPCAQPPPATAQPAAELPSTSTAQPASTAAGGTVPAKTSRSKQPADTIHAIVRLGKEGKSLVGIRNALNKEGRKNSSSKIWPMSGDHCVVKRILKEFDIPIREIEHDDDKEEEEEEEEEAPRRRVYVQDLDADETDESNDEDADEDADEGADEDEGLFDDRAPSMKRMARRTRGHPSGNENGDPQRRRVTRVPVSYDEKKLAAAQMAKSAGASSGAANGAKRASSSGGAATSKRPRSTGLRKTLVDEAITNALCTGLFVTYAKSGENAAFMRQVSYSELVEGAHVSFRISHGARLTFTSETEMGVITIRSDINLRSAIALHQGSGFMKLSVHADTDEDVTHHDKPAVAAADDGSEGQDDSVV